MSDVHATAGFLRVIACNKTSLHCETSAYCGNTAAAMTSIAILVTFYVFAVVCNISAADCHICILRKHTAAKSGVQVSCRCTTLGLVSGNDAAAHGKGAALHTDTAALGAGIRRNDTFGNRHRSVFGVDAAAVIVAVIAAADNIAALHGQRSVLHQDYPFAAAVPEYTALDVQCTSVVDLNRLVRALLAQDCAGEGDGMLFQWAWML